MRFSPFFHASLFPCFWSSSIVTGFVVPDQSALFTGVSSRLEMTKNGNSFFDSIPNPFAKAPEPPEENTSPATPPAPATIANKFDMTQRIESVKCAALGAISGSLAAAPVAYAHYMVLTSAPSMAQWEFATDMAAIQGALFAIVYRYAVREEDDNPMLNQGVVGAFVVVRTLSNISVPTDCKALPLSCGPPLGYADWSMIQQGVLQGAESAVLFGAVALALELVYSQKLISKFPN